jgi:hypothetical protein
MGQQKISRSLNPSASMGGRFATAESLFIARNSYFSSVLVGTLEKTILFFASQDFALSHVTVTHQSRFT